MSRYFFVALMLPVALWAGSIAAAQTLPDPPSTIAGSVTDEAGEVPAGLPVEAYVGNKLCGTSETVYTGEGSARVTVYAVDVVSDDQTPGCGVDGDAVRIKIGDRLSPKATVWEAGLVLFDIVFGENVTPKPIPTFTPTLTPTITPTPTLTLRVTPTPGGDDGTETPASGTATAPPESTNDGVASSTPGPPSSGDGGGGGFPVWGAIVLAVLGVGLVGGGVGIYLSRRTIPI